MESELAYSNTNNCTAIITEKKRTNINDFDKYSQPNKDAEINVRRFYIIGFKEEKNSIKRTIVQTDINKNRPNQAQ